MGSKIQNEDVKTLSELQALGADKVNLIHSDKIYPASSLTRSPAGEGILFCFDE